MFSVLMKDRYFIKVLYYIHMHQFYKYRISPALHQYQHIPQSSAARKK